MTQTRTALRKDPNTWAKSRWSSLGWGVHRDGFLPCLPESCRYAERYRCKTPPGRGETCPEERAEYQFWLDGYFRQFERARNVLGDEDFLARLRELALLELRRLRLRFRQWWLLNKMDELLHDPDEFTAEVERTHKYVTTLRNRWQKVYEGLQVASLPPMHGLIDIERVEWIQNWTQAGIGPVCDVRTREVTFAPVYRSLREPEPYVSPYANPEHWRFHW